jgi:hypothetical protein
MNIHEKYLSDMEQLQLNGASPEELDALTIKYAHESHTPYSRQNGRIWLIATDTAINNLIEAANANDVTFDDEMPIEIVGAAGTGALSRSITVVLNETGDDMGVPTLNEYPIPPGTIIIGADNPPNTEDFFKMFLEHQGTPMNTEDIAEPHKRTRQPWKKSEKNSHPAMRRR